MKAVACVEDYVPLAKSMARRYRHRVLGRLTEDEVLQVALIALWTAAEKFNPAHGVPFGAWAKKIMGRELAREARRAHRGSRIPWHLTEDVDGLEIELEGRPSDSVALIDHKRRYESMREAMRHLSAKQRYVVEQLYFAERCGEDIAAELRVTRQRVQQIAHRAFDIMRPRLVRLRGLSTGTAAPLEL